MTVVEAAALLAAVAFMVLVGFLIPVLIRVRKTVEESQRLLEKMNADVPPLVEELRTASKHFNELSQRARQGVEHATVLLHAVGEVGESVQLIHNVMKGSSGTLLTNVIGAVAGVRAAVRVMRERLRKNGAMHDGQ